MYYCIDYYAFTIPIQSPIKDISHESLLSFTNTVVSFLNLQPVHFLSPASWGIEKAKHPYHTRLRHSTTDLCISVGNVNAHLYIELAGKCCATFDGGGILDDVIQKSASRVSRIDFATDILCQTDPLEFSSQRKNKSFKSSGNKRTPSGRTEYIGGRTSERMARVYRYEPPHPRADFLRVEAEYKGLAAKAATKHYLEVGLQQATLDAHSAFGWEHPAWTPENGDYGKIAYKAYRPENASTVRWLYGDVIKSLSKAIASGLIDFDDWLKTLQEGLS